MNKTSDDDVREGIAELMNAKWQYMDASAEAPQSDYASLDEFNELGRQGWELVSAVRIGMYWNAIFKKRIIE